MHMWIILGSKTISLDEEAYKRLKNEKIGSESFSEVVKRLTRPIKRKSLLSFAGTLKLSSDELEIMKTALNDLEGQFYDMLG